MAFRSLVLCLSSPLAHSVAYCTQAWDKLQVATCSALQYVVCVHLRHTSRKIMETSLPFWLLDFCHKKDADNIEPRKWGCENEAVQLPQQLCSESTGCLVCSAQLLKIWRRTISSFIVFYSACRHSSTHLKKRFCNSALTGVELQDSRILSNYFFALHFQNCDSAWP